MKFKLVTWDLTGFVFPSIILMKKKIRCQSQHIDILLKFGPHPYLII